MTNLYQTVFQFLTTGYYTTKGSSYTAPFRKEFWSIFTRDIRGGIAWKAWCEVLYIGKKWTLTSVTHLTHARDVLWRLAEPIDGFYYLIVIDSLSKWPEILCCRRPTTEVVINLLYELFVRFGVVDCIVSDNGTQFTSADFHDFRQTFSIKHVTHLNTILRLMDRPSALWTH